MPPAAAAATASGAAAAAAAGVVAAAAVASAAAAAAGTGPAGAGRIPGQRFSRPSDTSPPVHERPRDSTRHTGDELTPPSLILPQHRQDTCTWALSSTDISL